MPAPKGNKNAIGNKGGRPTKYKAEFARVAKKLCELAATDMEIADALGINLTTLYAWRARHVEFSNSLKVGKTIADERVERSLFERATGYTFESEKIFNAQGVPLKVPYREHVPPDVTAQIFWLKNRQKERWRDKSEVEHSGTVGLADRIAEARKRT